MARGGARPGAGRPARKSANTSTVSRRARARGWDPELLRLELGELQHFPRLGACARPRASRGRKSKAVAGRQGQAVGDRSADPVCQKCTDPHGCAGRRDSRKHQGVGLDDAGAGGRGRWPDCGHARILAARQLGIAEIPVMVAAGWTEAQKRAYVLADNQLAITGSGWDPELLRLELGELKLSGFDLSLTGFGDLELKEQSLLSG